MSFDSYKNYEAFLFNDTIYFSSPTYFNDPFDCGLDLNFKKKSREYIRKHLIQILSDQIPNLNGDQEKKAKNFIDENFEEFSPENIEIRNSLRQNLNDFISRTGVCCFAEIKDNILMWSHYANYHKGFCIEFNYKKLEDALILFNRENNVITYMSRVIYKKNYPRLSGYNNEDMVDSLFIKSSNWKYEKEWRVIYSEGNGLKINLPVNVVSAIYLGLKIDSKNEDIVKKALSLKKYRIDLYKAKNVENQFAIAFEKM
jgi:hypothetical protein